MMIEIFLGNDKETIKNKNAFVDMFLFMHNFFRKFYRPDLKMYVCMTSRIFFLSIGQFLLSHLLNFLPYQAPV
jgi:hypothetical protein